jgi:hypothetical protein
MMLQSNDVATDVKWPIFESLWQRIEHTAYARVTKIILRDIYGETTLSRKALASVADQLANRDESFYWRMFDENHVELLLTDSLGFVAEDFPAFLRGEHTFSPRIKPVIPLPLFHVVQQHPTSARDWQGVQRIGSWVDRHIASMDVFLETVFDILKRAKELGAVALKDQCPITGVLITGLWRADAERLFNRIGESSPAGS